MSKMSSAMHAAGALVAACVVVVLCVCSAAAVGKGENANAALSASEIPEENTVAKTEVVYAKLNGAGALETAYVVNTLEIDANNSAHMLCDFGTYESVQNLTNATALGQTSDAVLIDVSQSSASGAKSEAAESSESATSSTFSYQGTMGKTNLPWNVAVRYYVDGKRVSADNMAGVSGQLSAEIDITQNTNATDASFFENYLVTATVTLSPDVATNISAPDAQIALSGANTQLTFMVMPGKEKTLSFTADVSNFEMSSIQVAAIPFSIAFDFPNTNDLISQFSQLTSAVNTLDAAASALSQGASSLSEGMESLTVGAIGLSSGTTGIAQGLLAYQQGLLSQASQLEKAAQDAGISDADLEAYKNLMEEYVNAVLEAFVQQFSQTYATEYASAYAQAYQQALQQGLDEQHAAAQATTTATEQASAAATSAASAAAEQVAKQSAASLEETVRELAKKAAYQAAYVASAKTLREAAAGLGSEQDANSLLGGAAAVASGAEQFEQGTQQAQEGAQEYAQGAQQFSEGMNTFNQETSSLPASVQSEIDAMLAEYDKSSFVPRSFTSSKNTKVKLVQFVLSTPEIACANNNDSADAEQEEQEQTPLDRLFALFQ